ncbi:hypothetical protein PsorP6_005673 [Peronosclerospora sorghi]|uniref:Uncharacterized protein n=1 Tax=Peronosclerospora sorghi TaxID=230839 RepID=A0ACC0W6Z9_9STRA|nr:hypothetical protein PsorP6_005673 [Peronosclerospora sorghi]
MFTSDERDRVYDPEMEDAHVTQTQRAEAKYNVAASPRPAARSMKEEEAINDFALQRQSSRRFVRERGRSDGRHVVGGSPDFSSSWLWSRAGNT